MSPLTQRILNIALSLLERALALPPDSARGAMWIYLAGKLVGIATAIDPPPNVAAEAEELRAELKASETSLADAVKQNQPS